jgi:hypothetical protein
MSDGAESLSLSMPDDGRSYARGMGVRVDRTVHSPDVLPDRRGDYEVDDWWPEPPRVAAGRCCTWCSGGSGPKAAPAPAAYASLSQAHQRRHHGCGSWPGHVNMPVRRVGAHHVTAWEAARNAAGVPVEWRFSTADARIKRTRLYPSL